MLSVKQEGIKYHFWLSGMTQPEIEPRFPGALANILPARSMNQLQIASLTYTVNYLINHFCQLLFNDTLLNSVESNPIYNIISANQRKHSIIIQ